MQLNPYLSFNGRCEEAFKFYAEVLGGKIEAISTWGDSPMADQVPAGMRDKIIHATLVAGETVVHGSDSPPDRYEVPKGISVTIQLDDVAKAEQIFSQLAKGGTLIMELQQTYWAKRFGMLVDRFGIPWMVNCGQIS